MTHAKPLAKRIATLAILILSFSFTNTAQAQTLHLLPGTFQFSDATRQFSFTLTGQDVISYDPNVGTVRAKAQFDNKDSLLWPGQYVNTSVTVRTIKDATVIPMAAIVQVAFEEIFIARRERRFDSDRAGTLLRRVD